MTDILMNLLKIIIAVAIAIITAYLVPYLKSLLSDDALSVVLTWVEQAVLYAQQVMQSSSGEDKKAAVLEFMNEVLEEEGIVLTSEQLDILIEAAVKTMKMQEGTTYEAVLNTTEEEEE